VNFVECTVQPVNAHSVVVQQMLCSSLLGFWIQYQKHPLPTSGIQRKLA